MHHSKIRSRGNNSTVSLRLNLVRYEQLLERGTELFSTRGNKFFAAVTMLILFLAASIFSSPALAQPRTQTRAASVVPSPQSILRFNPGDDRTISAWKQITDYFARLDATSDRVQVNAIGTTTLGRQMIAAFISAPENIRNLEKYKTI